MTLDNNPLIFANLLSQVWSTTQRAGCTDEDPEGKPPVLASWHAHNGSVVSVEYITRDQGALLLSASEDCSAKLWTLNGHYIGMFGQVRGVEFCVLKYCFQKCLNQS